MARYFQHPFAQNGDRQSIPDESVTEEVNYENGYTPAYELEKIDPDRRNIDRRPFNGILFDITENVKLWQEAGYPEFVADDGTGSPISYDPGRVVELSGVLYLANVQTTTVPPSSEWVTLGSPEDILRYQPGPVNVDVSGGVDVTLTGVASVSETIDLTGALTADINVIVPDKARIFTVINSTSGAFEVTVKTLAGTGIVVPQGEFNALRCDGTNVLSPATMAYRGKDIGEPFGVWDHLSGVPVPDNSGAMKFVRLTAGEAGVGGYNQGLLINEQTSGSGPTIIHQAEIATGPMAGAVINLLNSENRYLMPGENSGAAANDQMQNITGSLLDVYSSSGSADGAFTASGKPGNRAGNSNLSVFDYTFDSTTSPDARTGDHTNVKHAQATYYMRIA